MRVVVGLSGGVDSATSLQLLQEQGHELIGATLVMARGGAPSPAPEALERARLACARLGVPHVTRDVTQEFARHVTGPFVAGYLAGRTPSPCVACNREVKVRALVALADELGAERVATGHYVGLRRGEDGVTRLTRGQDRAKDQSYFLCQLEPAQVERLLPPLQGLTKDRVRQRARQAGLPGAAAADSQGVCFAPGGDYRALLAAMAPGAHRPGNLVDEQGRVLGRHQGVAGFTVGQRKGIGLSGGPWFVKALDPVSGDVTIVCGRPPEPAGFVVDGLALSVPADRLEGLGARVQTRYRAGTQAAHFCPKEDGSLDVTLTEPGALAAPGQTCAFYLGDIVLGGGTITTLKFSQRV